jgi:chromate transporter
MSYLGYKLGGWPGSALATAAFVLPSAILMLLLAAAYAAATVLPALGPAMHGLSAAVVGILLATTYRLGKANVTTPLLGGIALAAFGAGAWFGINAAFIVVAAGLVGIGLFSVPSAAQPSQQEGRR